MADNDSPSPFAKLTRNKKEWKTNREDWLDDEQRAVKEALRDERKKTRDNVIHTHLESYKTQVTPYLEAAIDGFKPSVPYVAKITQARDALLEDAVKTAVALRRDKLEKAGWAPHTKERRPAFDSDALHNYLEMIPSAVRYRVPVKETYMEAQPAQPHLEYIHGHQDEIRYLKETILRAIKNANKEFPLPKRETGTAR